MHKPLSSLLAQLIELRGVARGIVDHRLDRDCRTTRPLPEVSRRRGRLGVAAAVVMLVASTAVAATSAAATTARPAIASASVHYAIDVPVCAQPKDPNAMRCFAMKRVDGPATRKSATSAKPRPPPTAAPCTAVTMGVRAANSRAASS